MVWSDEYFGDPDHWIEEPTWTDPGRATRAWASALRILALGWAAGFAMAWMLIR